MTRRQIILLALGVILLHAAGFWLISGTSPLPKVEPIPRPTFVAREATITDKETGETTIYREFSVSTKLALPDALMERKP